MGRFLFKIRHELLAAAEKCSSKSRDEAMVLLNNMTLGACPRFVF